MTPPDVSREYRVARCNACDKVEILKILERNGGVCARCMRSQDIKGIATYLHQTCDPAIAIKPDPVHRPAHYRRGPYELMDVLEAWGLHKDGHLLQAAQYIFRCKYKGTEREDLEKAKWYIERRITTIDREKARQEDQPVAE